MKTTRTVFWRVFLLTALLAHPFFALAEAPLEARTEDGRRVILHPDGRWEFGAATGPGASVGTTQSAARPDDRQCQGGLFGVGRRVCPGDPDYNRGSLNPKLR
jgi:hypothetical protein